MEIYLYGAGVVAYGAYQAVRELFGISVKGFLVTEEEGQPHEIDGISVFGIAKYQDRLSESKILIAVPEEYQDSIERELRNRSLFHYKRLDSHSEYELMGRYLKKTKRLSLIEDYETRGQSIHEEDICVYMAVSHRDKELKKISGRGMGKKDPGGSGFNG